MNIMLRVKNLTTRYGDFVALDDLCFSLDSEILGIIGENGAGKTTLLKILAGLLEPTSGEINLFGMVFLKNKERMKRRVGYVPNIICVQFLIISCLFSTIFPISGDILWIIAISPYMS